LEEPPSHAVFILKTDAAAGLLPTVRSRCLELKAQTTVKAADDEIDELAQDFIVAISGGNAQLVAYMFRLEKLDRLRFPDFLNTAREKSSIALQAAIKSHNGDIDTEAMERLSRAERVLLQASELFSFNVSLGHISGLICASMLSGG
jgi:DNA polymerase III delta prime subunit